MILTNCDIGFGRSDATIVVSDDGTISSITCSNPSSKNADFDAKGLKVFPGLVDTHTHGYTGFGSEDCSKESIMKWAENLADTGTTSFFPSISAMPGDEMIRSAGAIADAIDEQKKTQIGSRMLGIHLEGPFLSQEEMGAQDPEGLMTMDTDFFERLLDACRGYAVCTTVSPELPGFDDFARICNKHKVVMLAGHTNAKFNDIKHAKELGLKSFTHCYNAMRTISRYDEPGTVGAVLIEKDLYAEAICDGVHVHPELFKLLARNKDHSRIVMVTDSLTPTGSDFSNLPEKDFGPGIGVRKILLCEGVPAYIGKNGSFWESEQPDLLMGSGLTLAKAVKNVASWGFDDDSLRLMSGSNASRLYGLEKAGRIEEGCFADFTVFDDEYNLKAVFIRGRRTF